MILGFGLVCGAARPDFLARGRSADLTFFNNSIVHRLVCYFLLNSLLYDILSSHSSYQDRLPFRGREVNGFLRQKIVFQKCLGAGALVEFVVSFYTRHAPGVAVVSWNMLACFVREGVLHD